MTAPYNPLDRRNLAESIDARFMREQPSRLSELASFQGAGVYALYYEGGAPEYAELVARTPPPVYVGKAIPQGGRTGGLSATPTASQGRALYSRLQKHARSLVAAGFQKTDFRYRSLVLDEVWIPLGENMLIETHKPVWNIAITGFGNNPLGSGREKQNPSLWDLLHPGRIAAEKLMPTLVDQEFARRQLADEIAGRTREKIPTAARKQLATNEDTDNSEA